MKKRHQKSKPALMVELTEACEAALPIVAAMCNSLGECCLESDAEALFKLQDVIPRARHLINNSNVRTLHSQLDHALDLRAGSEESGKGDATIFAIIADIAVALGAKVHRMDDECRFLMDVQMDFKQGE